MLWIRPQNSIFVCIYIYIYIYIYKNELIFKVIVIWAWYWPAVFVLVAEAAMDLHLPAEIGESCEDFVRPAKKSSIYMMNVCMHKCITVKYACVNIVSCEYFERGRRNKVQTYKFNNVWLSRMSKIGNVGDLNLKNYRFSFCSRYINIDNYCIVFLKMLLFEVRNVEIKSRQFYTKR